MFDILRPKPPLGKIWIEGRLTRVQRTTRPENVLPEAWSELSDKQKKEAIKEWPAEKAKREEARAKRGIFHVPEKEINEYNKALARARDQIALDPAPAMPVIEKPREILSEGNKSTEKSVANASKHRKMCSLKATAQKSGSEWSIPQ
jgi:hypothetical protein